MGAGGGGHHMATLYAPFRDWGMWQYVAVCCGVSQCGAVCRYCCMWQNVAAGGRRCLWVPACACRWLCVAVGGSTGGGGGNFVGSKFHMGNLAFQFGRPIYHAKSRGFRQITSKRGC